MQELLLNFRDAEIRSTVETLSSTPGLIKKTIRYGNGMMLVIMQDFFENVFSISMVFQGARLDIRPNGVVRIQKAPTEEDPAVKDE